MISSSYPELTETIINAWDKTVASPNLPPKLTYVLKNQGFTAIRTEAIPSLNTSFFSNSFSVNSLEWLCKNAYKQNMITRDEGKKWITDLDERKNLNTTLHRQVLKQNRSFLRAFG